MVKTRRQTILEGLRHKASTNHRESSIEESLAVMDHQSTEGEMTLDPRMFKRPTSTSHITVPGGSTPVMEIVDTCTVKGGHEGSKRGKHHPNAREHREEVNDKKLDAIMSTLNTMQESIRELHNEFNALKPRVSQITTTSASSGLLVKSNVSDDPNINYAKFLQKRRRKGPTQ